MTARFQLEHWSAWAPGLATDADWRGWFADPQVPVGEPTPPLAEMPAMMRRRIDPLGRVALQAAYRAQGEQPTGPVVFASRWGEIGRSVGLLEELAREQPLSPTAFSLSVHNAVGALYSIARKDQANYQAIAAGEHTAEAAFAEALGLLADGAPRVLIVFFEAPLPERYAAFQPGGELVFPHAWAALVAPAAAGAAAFALEPAAHATEAPSAIPAGLRPLRFLLGEAAELRRGRWRWSRHAI